MCIGNVYGIAIKCPGCNRTGFGRCDAIVLVLVVVMMMITPVAIKRPRCNRDDVPDGGN